MEKPIWEYYWVKDGITRTKEAQVKNPQRTRIWRRLRKALDENKVEKIGYNEYDYNLENLDVDDILPPLD